MRTRTAMTVAGSAAALLLLGGVAYAAVQSVDTRPGPQVVVPTSTDDRTHARGGADDPANHDVNDDNNRNRHGRGHGADDPATHDVNDDRSGRSGGGHGSDDSGSGHGSDDSGSGHGGHGGDD
jgi:hypothetical protein